MQTSVPAAADFLQRQLAAFVVKLLETIEAIPRVAHHLASLRNAAQHLSQLQQSHFVLDDFLVGAHSDISSLAPAGAFYRKCQIKSWLGHVSDVCPICQWIMAFHIHLSNCLRSIKCVRPSEKTAQNLGPI